MIARRVAESRPTVLKVSSFFFYQLKDKNQELSEQLFLQQGQLTQLDSLKSKITTQENFFKATTKKKMGFFSPFSRVDCKWGLNGQRLKTGWSTVSDWSAR